MKTNKIVMITNTASVRTLTLLVASLGGWHHTGLTLWWKSNFCGWIYKEHWTLDHLERGKGWEWWRWPKKVITVDDND